MSTWAWVAIGIAAWILLSLPLALLLSRGLRAAARGGQATDHRQRPHRAA